MNFLEKAGLLMFIAGLTAVVSAYIGELVEKSTSGNEFTIAVMIISGGTLFMVGGKNQ